MVERSRPAGSLTPGKRADLVVLGDDPRRVNLSPIAGIEIVATLVDGRRAAPSKPRDPLPNGAGGVTPSPRSRSGHNGKIEVHTHPFPPCPSGTLSTLTLTLVEAARVMTSAALGPFGT